MNRYNKKNMTVGSKIYEDLLSKEMDVWSKYTDKDESNGDFSLVKKTVAYQTYRKNTIEMELEHIKNCGKNIDILELGSADGWLTNEMLKLQNVNSITSVDIALDEKLVQHYNSRSKVVKGDLNMMEKIVFSHKFDCIITHGTLHHLVDPKKTLEYCILYLLKPNGILVVNDTWVLQSAQVKVNAFFYELLNRLPHALLKLKIVEALKIIFFILPKILCNMNFAESIAHNHEASPFESISSADDYREIYNKPNVEVLYFKNLAALPGLQNSWSKSPTLIKAMIQKLDDLLIASKLLKGDLHICIVKKK